MIDLKKLIKDTNIDKKTNSSTVRKELYKELGKFNETCENEIDAEKYFKKHFSSKAEVKTNLIQTERFTYHVIELFEHYQDSGSIDYLYSLKIGI